MQFPRPVEPEDGVEVSRGPIEIVLAAAVREVVAQLLDTYNWAAARAGGRAVMKVTNSLNEKLNP